MKLLQRLHRPIHCAFVAACLLSGTVLYHIGELRTVLADQRQPWSDQENMGSQSARIDALKDRDERIEKHLDSNDVRLDDLSEKTGAISGIGGTAVALIGVLAALGFLGKPGHAELPKKEG